MKRSSLIRTCLTALLLSAADEVIQ